MVLKFVGYAILRIIIIDGLSYYDNFNDVKYVCGYDVFNMKKIYGYDVLKGFFVGNGMFINFQIDRYMFGEVFNDIYFINLRGMLFRMLENKRNIEGCFI